MSFFVSGQLPHQRAAFNGPVPVAGTALVLPTSFSGQGAAAVRLANGRFLETTGTTTAGIQEAINHLGADGGVVYLSAGEYEITTTIEWNPDDDVTNTGNIALIGDASASTKIIMTSGPLGTLQDEVPMLVFDAVGLTEGTPYGNITVKNITFQNDGFKAHNNGQRGHCITLGNIVRAEISNCVFTGVFPKGIDPDDEDVGMLWGIGSGVYIRGDVSSDIRIVNNEIEGLSCGIWARDGERILIQGNICRLNSGAGILALLAPTEADDPAGTSLFSLSIIGNTCNDNLGDGIQAGVAYSAGKSGVVIMGNTCSANGDGSNFVGRTDYTANGIYVKGAQKAMVANNVCSLNFGNGILLRNSPHSVISGNICTNNGQNGDVDDDDGIQLYAEDGEDCQRCAISGNVCDDDQGGGPTQWHGIHERVASPPGLWGGCICICNVASDDRHLGPGGAGFNLRSGGGDANETRTSSPEGLQPYPT